MRIELTDKQIRQIIANPIKKRTHNVEDMGKVSYMDMTTDAIVYIKGTWHDQSGTGPDYEGHIEIEEE